MIVNHFVSGFRLLSTIRCSNMLLRFPEVGVLEAELNGTARTRNRRPDYRRNYGTTLLITDREAHPLTKIIHVTEELPHHHDPQVLATFGQHKAVTPLLHGPEHAQSGELEP